MTEIKEEILELLKKGKMTSTKIYHSIKFSGGYWKIVMLLRELEAEGKIIMERERSFTYWRKNEKSGLEKDK